jgi:hypothetical protein
MGSENLLQDTEEKPNIKGFLESLETNNKESNNIITEEGEKEGIIMEKELQESVIKNNARVTIKEALSNSSKAEAIRDLKEFQSTVPSHMKETLDKVESTISRLAEDLDKEVKDKDVKLTEATKSTSSLNEKLKATEKLYGDLKEKHEKAIKVIESFKKQDKVTKKTLSEAKQDVKSMFEDIKHFRKERFYMLEDIAKWLIKEGRFAEAKKLVNELKTIKEKNDFASRIAKYLEKTSKKKENFDNEDEMEMQEDDFIEPLESDFFDDGNDDFIMVDEEEPGSTDSLAYDTEVDPSYNFEGESVDAFEDGFEEEEEESEEGDFSFEDGTEVEGDEMEEEDEMETEEYSFNEEDEMEDESEEEMELEEDDDMESDDEEDESMELEEDDYEMEDEEMEEEYTSPDSFEDEIKSSYNFEGDKDTFSERLIDNAIKKHKASLKKESKKVVKKPFKKESKGKMKVRKDVYKYYESFSKVNPALKDIKNSVLKSKSLEQAIKISEAFIRKNSDSSVGKKQVKESFSLPKKSGWMQGSKLL